MSEAALGRNTLRETHHWRISLWNRVREKPSEREREWETVTGEWGIYLNSGLSKVGFKGDFLPGVDIRIASLLKGSLKLLELGTCKGCPYAALFAFLCQYALVGGRVHLVRQTCRGRVREKLRERERGKRGSSKGLVDRSR